MDNNFIHGFLENSRFTAITGKMGSGKTLLGVALLKLIHDYNKGINIVSDIIIHNIKSESFKSRNLHDYRNSLIFLDTLDIYKPSLKIEEVMDNFIGFINDLQENNNHLIITTNNINYIQPDLIDFIDTIIKTNFNPNDNYITFTIIDKDADSFNISSPYLFKIEHIDRYYNSYDCTTVGRLI